VGRCRLDVDTGRQVRTFAGHLDSITDLSISADARWLLSASKDGTLRVWDIPAARTLQVPPPPISQPQVSMQGV